MTQALRESFSFFAATAAVPVALPRTRYTSGQCWFEISGHQAIFDHAQQGMHGFTVQCGLNTVLHAYGTLDGTAGAVLNISGDYEPILGPVHNKQLPANLRVVPEDAVIITSSAPVTGTRGPLPYPGGRSACDEMLPIVFVAWTPSPDYLRPPAIGDTQLAKFFRSQPVSIAALDMAKLPSVIDIDSLPVDWSGWGKGKPSIDRFEKLFARFCGEVYTTWSTDTGTPDWQNVGYGREQAGTGSVALALLASTLPVARKATLARNLCQRGFDLVGALASGRPRLAQCNGGHLNGRKALVVLLGYLLGCDPIRFPSQTLGVRCFAEDFQYVTGTRFDGGNVRWRYNSTGDQSDQWALPIVQWSDAWVWEFGGYFQHCCGSQIGTALFMRLTGNVQAMSPQMDSMIEWYMSKPIDWMRSDKCRVEWGTDWSMSEGGDFCSAAWRKHAQ